VVRPIAEGRAAEPVQRAADELYGLPLPDFTKARDEHARRLREEGLRDEAEAVKALRKPTAAAWALNQLARRRPDEVGQLLATGRRLREAQDELLAGGDRSSLQQASADERELVAELARAATAIAGEQALPAGASLAERIRSTLHAAALDQRTAAELGAGCLVREQEAVGLFGASPAEAKRTAPKRTAPKRKDPEPRRKLERELSAARTEERTAQREHAAAVKATERAEKRARDAQRRAEEARAELEEAKRREREATVAYDRAARTTASAEKKLA
jgi:hypothetical protein